MRLLPALFISLLAIPPLTHAQRVSKSEVSFSAVAPLETRGLTENSLESVTLAEEGSTKMQVLPVWATSDGRWLATIALSAPTQPLPMLAPQIGSPVDWRLIDVTQIVSSSVRWQVNDQTYAGIRLDQAFTLLPPTSSAHDTAPCWMSGTTSCSDGPAFNATTFQPIQAIFSPKAQVGWSSTGMEFNVSLGLSQASYSSSSQYGAFHHPLSVSPLSLADSPFLFLPIGNKALFGLAGLSTLQNGRSTLMETHGEWQFNPMTRFTVDAGVAHTQLSLADYGVAADYNQAAFKLGISRGALSGNLIGRTISPIDSLLNKRWNSIDLGVTWRTPWQGELIFGTQNLWSTDQLPHYLSNSMDNVKAPSGRTPYVQYHQDL